MTREALLIAASVVLVATLIVPRMISHRSLWARALWQLGAFAVFTVLVRWILGSPLAPNYDTSDTSLRIWGQAIEIGWWVIAAQTAIGLTRLFLVFETRPRETRIISDLLAGVIYLVTLLAIVNFVFDVPIGGLLATSGVIAIVLGLALQSSLADVFSGIAVGIERPYSAGDLIWVEGGIEGRVIQINWRSTHIATMNKDVAIVPNSIMAKSRLINHSLPSTVRGHSITVRLDARQLPAQCMAALISAARTCMLLLDDPLPSVARTELNGDGAVYEISFSVQSSALISSARTEMLGQVQNHLRHAGISLAVSGQAEVPPTKIPTPADILAESDWFGVLVPEDRSLLAEHLTEVLVKPGESLIKKDDEPEALFILASGTVEISNGEPGAKGIIYRVGPGASLGAVGLITGTAYAATATALTPVKAYRLDKKAIGTAMGLRPELVTNLEALARHGQDMQHIDVVAHEGAQLQSSHVFLSSLRGFLRKLAVAAPY